MFSIGIDVSKEKSTVCIIDQDGKIIQKPFDIQHTTKVLSEFIMQIKDLGADAKVIMEATGNYHLPLVIAFQEATIFVSVINPLLMKKFVSVAIRKGKTDKIDSLKIAQYGIANWTRLKKYELNQDTYDELKVLGRQYAHYTKIKVENKLAFASILDRIMPGIKIAIKSKNTSDLTKDKLCDFVEKYLHYDNITTKSEAKFIESYKKWAKKKGYQASETKAKQIYAIACSGIPTLPSSAASTKMLTREAIRVLREINKTLETILTQMRELASTLPEYETVLEMKGVGDTLGPRLIAEIGDVKRFYGSKALIAYAGIDAPPYQSGNFMGTNRHISKRGSWLLRKTGYEIIRCIKTIKPKEDTAVYDYISKKESEGKAKKVANIAGLNKFLRIYYARVKAVYDIM